MSNYRPRQPPPPPPPDPQVTALEALPGQQSLDPRGYIQRGGRMKGGGRMHLMAIEEAARAHLIRKRLEEIRKKGGKNANVIGALVGKSLRGPVSAPVPSSSGGGNAVTALVNKSLRGPSLASGKYSGRGSPRYNDPNRFWR